MKIILSPSKLQTCHRLEAVPLSPLPCEETAKKLAKALEGLIAKGGPLLDSYGKTLGGTGQVQVGHALCTYTGLVFKEIDWRCYDQVQWDYIDRHLRILSAYYGILTPLTGIAPYRLDMLAKLPGINLYQYWAKCVGDYFADEDLIVNLASKEYSKMLDLKGLKGRVLCVEFKEEGWDGGLKVVTVHAKRARGLMVQYMVEGLIEDPESLKDFSEAKYRFYQQGSTASNYVFVRPFEAGES